MVGPEVQGGPQRPQRLLRTIGVGNDLKDTRDLGSLVEELCGVSRFRSWRQSCSVRSGEGESKKSVETRPRTRSWVEGAGTSLVVAVQAGSAGLKGSLWQGDVVAPASVGHRRQGLLAFVQWQVLYEAPKMLSQIRCSSWLRENEYED